LRQALELQQCVFEEGIKKDITPVARAQLARAWDILEDRKGILRGRPLPGSLKPEKPKAKSTNKSLPVFLELPQEPEAGEP
jgi:hypothetical protein